MRHILAWPALVVLSLGAACARTPPAPVADGGTGGIVSAESSFDFGAATEGDKLKHVFVLTNTGSKTINLDRLQPASSALQAAVTPTLLAPGAKANLEVTFDTLDHPGEHDKLITIASSDPSVDPAKVRVRARVDPLIAVEQEEEEDEEDEDVRVGETKTREFKILGKKAGEAQLAIERVTSPDVTAEIVSKQEDGGTQHEIKVTVQGKKLGHFHAGVFLRTGLPTKPELKHYFEWSVVGNVLVVPRSLHFVSGVPAPQQEKVAELKSRLDGFTVKEAKSDSPAFKASVQRSASGKSWELHVIATDREALSKLQTARIEVTTNDPVQPSITVPLTVAPARSASPAPSNRPPR